MNTAKVLTKSPIDNELINHFQKNRNLVKNTLNWSDKDCDLFIKGLLNHEINQKLNILDRINQKLEKQIRINEINERQKELNKGAIRKSKEFKKYHDLNSIKILIESQIRNANAEFHKLTNESVRLKDKVNQKEIRFSLNEGNVNDLQALEIQLEDITIRRKELAKIINQKQIELKELIPEVREAKGELHLVYLDNVAPLAKKLQSRIKEMEEINVELKNLSDQFPEGEGFYLKGGFVNPAAKIIINNLSKIK